jgi:hypothetical protein
MIYTDIREIGALKSRLEVIFEIKVMGAYFVARSPRRLYFYERETLKEVSQVEIPVDNSFGSKELMTINDLCYTPVFSKKDSNFPSEGEHKHAELHAYSKDGLMWRYHLEGWSTGFNAGGVFVVNNTIVVGVKLGDKKSLVFLDSTTGKETRRVDGIDIDKTGGSILSPTTNFSKNSQIGFRGFESELYTVIEFSVNEFIPTELPGDQIQTVSLAKDHFLLYHIEERQYSKLSKFMYTDVSKREVYSLDFEFRAYRTTVNQTGNLVVFLDKDDCSFHCFNTESESVIWKWKSECDRYPAHFIFDRNNNLIVLDGDWGSDQSLVIIDGKSGEVIQQLQDTLGFTNDGYPFLIDDRIIVAKEGKLMALSNS